MKGIVFGKGFLGTKISQELGYILIGKEVNPLNLDLSIEFLDKEKPDVVINAIGKMEDQV
jgi:dTDP-4-dehydrorhamnose reductase